MLNLQHFEYISRENGIDSSTCLDKTLYENFLLITDPEISTLRQYGANRLIKEYIDNLFGVFLENPEPDEMVFHKVTEVVILALAAGNVDIVEYLLLREKRKAYEGCSVSRFMQGHYLKYTITQEQEKNRFVWNNVVYPNAFVLYKTLLPHRDDGLWLGISSAFSNDQNRDYNLFKEINPYSTMFFSMIASSNRVLNNGLGTSFCDRIVTMLLRDSMKDYTHNKILLKGNYFPNGARPYISISQWREYYADKIFNSDIALRVYGEQPTFKNLLGIHYLFGPDMADRAVAKHGIR